MTEDDNDEDHKSFPALLDRIATGSYEKVAMATTKTISLGTGAADGVADVVEATVGGVAGVVGSTVTGLTGVVEGVGDIAGLPHLVPQIDELTRVGIIAANSLTVFAVLGSIYFSSKTVRELLQWRRFIKYRKR